MRSVLTALLCLAIGVLGALGYSHYLGEGKQLADIQAELNTAKTSLAKATQESSQAKSETDSMSAQIQQLSSTKEELKKQLEELKGASPAAATTSAPNPMAGMAGMMKAGMAEHYQQQLLLLKSRLHLTPEQEAVVKAAMDQEGKRAEEMSAKMFAGGKIDPQAMADLKNLKSVDQTLNDILTPDQKTAYQQIKTDQKNSAAEMMVTVEMNQVSPLLQLNDSQKDQVYSALYQVQLDTQDPNWIKNNVTTSATDPLAILEAQAKAKEDALAKILTPDQLATYHQQAQSQLNLQKSMMQKFAPPTAASAPAPAPAP
jgi:chromosome segregation ATPase